MEIVCLHDKKEIEYYLMKNVFLNIYPLGDLDDFFWNHTIWYALKENSSVKSIALIYSGLKEPSLLASSFKDDIYTNKLLQSIKYYLPKRFYGHMNEGADRILRDQYSSEYFGRYLKMGLQRTDLLVNSEDISCVEQLTGDDLSLIMKLYEEGYEGNWFEKRMMETGMYFGIKEGGRLISIAGVHTFSSRYKVAAIGNIVTHPDYRGKGLCRRTVTKLCKELYKYVDYIGLYVKEDNISAVSCYERIGFKTYGSHEEYMFQG